MAFIDLTLEDPAAEPGAALDLAPAAVRRSWERSSALGAPSRAPEVEPLLDDGTLRWHRERAAPILHALNDLLEPVLGVFQTRDFTLLFADRDGVVVDQRAGGGFAEEARAVRLQPGAVWDERTRGTNAIGTALAEGLPVVVRGRAHFAQVNAGLVCYAAPVRDPWGELLGVLDATSYVDRSDPMAGAAVLAAARAIEEALRLSSLQRCGGGSVVERLLGRVRDPALLVSPDGRVTHANRPAVERGLPLGSAFSAGLDVVRTRASIDGVLGIDVHQLEAAARGQVRLPLVVEPLESDGRIGGYLLVLGTPSVRPLRPGPSHPAFARLIGTDPALVRVREHARKVAASTLPVMLRGETGTGKELVAHAIHAASPRSDQPLIALNCGAVTPSLVHSELFGYVGGSFTGADPAGRTGRLASADGGTLFLDEIADLPLQTQATLLRFLEDGSYRRVGEDQERYADVRLVCATCQDLEERVADGRFRADLFYRLRGAVLELPPLRERSDLPGLCTHLLIDLADSLRLPRVPELSAAARQVVIDASWPGNVRELRMALHHAVVLADGAPTLEPWHFPRAERTAMRPALTAVEIPSLAEAEARVLGQAMDRYEGNVSEVARVLGVARSTVYRLLKKHDLDG